MRSFYFLLALLLSSVVSTINAQSFLVERSIVFTDSIEDEGIKLAISTDDGEQINDEIDGLYDDDLDAGWEGAPEDQNVLITGLRFQNLYIPQGARIDSAFLVLTSHEGKSSDDVARLTILANAYDHAPTFSDTELFTNRPAIGSTVEWTIAEEWELWGTYRSPDIASLIQSIVDRGGWLSGNAMSFLLAGENQGVSDFENAREFESFENISDPEDGGDGQNHPERNPKLLVYYSITNGRIDIPIQYTETIDNEGVVLEASSDDAEQQNNEMDALFDDDLDAGWEGAPEDQNVLITGLRFRNVGVPVNATIDSAYILVWSHEGKSAEDVARISITGERNPNPQTYTEDNLISTRPATDAVVLWEVAEDWELWGAYRTPDLKSIVQELIDQPAWTPGNAMAFALAGENQGVSDLENAREFESYENISDPEDGGDGQNHPERRPRLVIYFSSGTSSVFNPGADVRPLHIYPNPTSDFITIDLETFEPATLTIVDNSGSIVKGAYSEFANQLSLSVQGLPSGTFYAKVIQNNKVYVQAFVVSGIK